MFLGYSIKHRAILCTLLKNINMVLQITLKCNGKNPSVEWILNFAGR